MGSIIDSKKIIWARHEFGVSAGMFTHWANKGNKRTLPLSTERIEIKVGKEDCLRRFTLFQENLPLVSKVRHSFKVSVMTPRTLICLQ